MSNRGLVKGLTCPKCDKPYVHKDLFQDWHCMKCGWKYNRRRDGRAEAFAFMRGMADRIRDMGCAEIPMEPVREGNTWRFVTHAGLRVFKVIPHGRLMYFLGGEAWSQIAWVRSEEEAEIAISGFIAGCSDDQIEADLERNRAR